MSGNAPITNVPDCVVSCAIDQDVINPAREILTAEGRIIPIVVVVCAESLVFVLYARKMTGLMPSPKRSWEARMKKTRYSFSFQTVNTFSRCLILTGNFIVIFFFVKQFKICNRNLVRTNLSIRIDYKVGHVI